MKERFIDEKFIVQWNVGEERNDMWRSYGGKYYTIEMATKMAEEERKLMASDKKIVFRILRVTKTIVKVL